MYGQGEEFSLQESVETAAKAAEAADTENAQEAPSEVEQEAINQGWQPKDDYKGDPDKWVPADMFVERGKWMKTVHRNKQEITGLRKAVEDMKSLLDRAQDTAFEKAREELRAQKIEAISNNEGARVLDIEDKMKMLDVKATEAKSTIELPANDDEGQDSFRTYFEQTWIGENKWYQKDKDMTEYADEVGVAYKVKNPESTPEQVFKHVTSKVNYMFKDKGQNTTRARATSVGSSSTTVASGSAKQGGKTYAGMLTEQEREVARNFSRMGVMTVEEYAKQLKATK